MYIEPLTKIYSSFSEAKEDFEKYGYHVFLFEERVPLGIGEIAKGMRNLIVGEPGVGKTELLNRIQAHHLSIGDKTCLVNLRSPDPVQEIEKFVKTRSKQKVLLLDALDETPYSQLSNVIQIIEKISDNHPEITIYLSSRWIFINKYAKSFPSFKVIRILPFTYDQIVEYLIGAGNKQKDVEELLTRSLHFNHSKTVLQIPRYLSYLGKFIERKSIQNIKHISRSELFEYFIYSKLEEEDGKLNTNQKNVVKRVLEKIALIMEIYQKNTISKDELLTIFDEVSSDLKLVVLSQVQFETFIEKTVLQPSFQNLDYIEFENTEFQEYLAAKEIARFDEPHRVAFNFAADKDISEINPSWFNTITFLVDLIPGILEQLLEFSGIRGAGFKIVDDNFFTFLSRIDTTNIPDEYKRKVFYDVLNYYHKTLQWLPGAMTSALPGFYTPDVEAQLKLQLEAAEEETGTKRFVPVGNTLYIVAYLLGANIKLDRAYWKTKLIKYSNDTKDSSVVARHALYGLEKLKDPEVIKDIQEITEIKDELVLSEYLSACIALDPDNPKTLQSSIDAVRANNSAGREGLYRITKKESLITFLKTYIEDANFRKEFLDDTSIFKKKDLEIVEHIEAIYDAEIGKLCVNAVVQSVKDYLGHHARESHFILGLMRLLKRKEKSFIKKILPKLKDKENNNVGLYFAQDFFAQILDIKDIPLYIDFLLAENEKYSAVTTMMKIKFSQREDREALYEAGRPKLVKEYEESEKAQNRSDEPEKQKRQENLLKDFRHRMEPEPGKFMTSVFSDYVHYADEIGSLLTAEDKKRFKELIIESTLAHDPSAHGLTIESENEEGGSRSYRASEIAHRFGDALLAAKKLGLNITPYRKNIALHIPFAYDTELNAIFDLISDFSADELSPVLDIYRKRNTDLWRHQTDSFIRMVERYHVSESVPILRELTKETKLRPYVRKEAVRVAESLSSDPNFLRDIFNLYKDATNPEEKDIAHTANGLLITVHGDREAVVWRLQQIKNKVIPFIRPQSGQVHRIGDAEDELRHGKPYAKPLTELKLRGFEKDYLEMLDYAIEVWGRGDNFHSYAQYVWEIVYAYFENLKEYKTYEPLKLLEEKVASLQGKEGANWLAYGIVNLRRSYLYKPSNISEAVRKYNEAKNLTDKRILNSEDLFTSLKNAIEVDLRNWVEGEGAYDVIVAEKKFKGNADYEKLVQKTASAKLESILSKRGYGVLITREEELLDGKKTDLIVRYGFVGPVIIEVKLASNGDIKSAKPETTKSYESMKRYMSGYGASHGIFLIMDNTGSKIQIKRAMEAFGQIKPFVWSVSLDCFTPASLKRKGVKPVHKKSAKKKK